MPAPLGGRLEHLLRGRRVLIIGGAGFIGSHIAEALREMNDVRIFDNFARSGRASAAALEGCELVRGDVLDAAAVRDATEGMDIVFHLAAIAGIFTVTEKPLTTMQVNLIGAYNAMSAAAEAGVNRFVYVSSSEVYGPRVYLGREDDMTAQGAVNEPRWGYAVSKLAGEFFANAFYLQKGLASTSLRYFNVYGPRQVGEGAVHNFVVAALKTRPVRIYGSGLQIRAWTYIDDALQGTLLAAASDSAPGKTYNIGNPATACTLITLADKVIELAGSTSHIEFEPQKLADVDLRVPDVSLAKRDLGFNPQVGLDEGLRRTIRFYREELDTNR